MAPGWVYTNLHSTVEIPYNVDVNFHFAGEDSVAKVPANEIESVFLSWKKMMKNILSQEFSRLFQVEIFNKPSNAICFSVPFIPGYLKISYSNKIKYTNICDFYQILEYYKIENPESLGSRKKNEFIKRSYRFRRIRFSRSTIVD